MPPPKKHLLACPLLLSLLLTLQATQASERLFTPPEAPFIVFPKEGLQKIPLPSGSVEAAQKVVDQARQQSPNVILFLCPTGNLEVGSVPLRLGSDMCLQLSPTAGLVAGANCNAQCLVLITNSENVSIFSSGGQPALLDGGGKAISGISVSDGIRVNIDNLMVIHCARTGLDYKGNNALAPNGAGSVTRCIIQSNGIGLRVDQSAGFVCLDNRFEKNSTTGLEINSLTSIVAGNIFSGNKIALRSSSDRGVVTRNIFEKNDLALDLTANSTDNLVSENRSTSDNLTVNIAGSAQNLFHNRFAGSANVSSDARKIYLLENESLVSNPQNTNVVFFNPPTFANPHTNSTIISGMGRYDITVTGGLKVPPPKQTGAVAVVKTPPTNKMVPVIPVDIATAQDALDRAKAAHPNDVVVLHLAGEFVAKTPQGLQLSPNTCVILGDNKNPGRIIADLGIPIDPLWDRAAPITQVVLMASNGLCSFSGGKIDAGRQAFHGFNASSNASSTAIIEGVNITSTARDGIYIKGRRSEGPLFIYKCDVYACGNRCIWPHVCSPVHSIANVCVGGGQDGIDLDAGSKDCTALFNICSGNRRHGIFLEEASHNNIVFGNVFSGNGGSGVHIWNEEVQGNTGSNCIVANHCFDNRKGISAGGRAADKTASENLVFNNVCRANLGDGLSAGNSHATNNAFEQSVVGENMGSDIQVSDSAASFFFNVVTPTTVSQ